MKITVLHFEQLFPTGVFANQRLRAEATIDEGDNITDCYKRLQQEVENAFIKLNPQINWGEQPQPVTEQKIDSKEDSMSRMLNAINSCSDLKVLESFKLLVKNNPEFQMAYSLKEKELQ